MIINNFNKIKFTNKDIHLINYYNLNNINIITINTIF